MVSNFYYCPRDPESSQYDIHINDGEQFVMYLNTKYCHIPLSLKRFQSLLLNDFTVLELLSACLKTIIKSLFKHKKKLVCTLNM